MSFQTGVPFDDIQNATFTLLNGVITGKVYDEPKKNKTYPYTIIGEPTCLPNEARGVKGLYVVWPWKSYSRDEGGKWQVYTIMGEIVAALTDAKLSMTSWVEVSKTFNQGKVERLEKEPGPLTFMGITTMLITVAKK